MASFQEELAIQNEAIEEVNAIKDKIASVARNKTIPVHNGYTQIDVLDKIETNTIPTPAKTLKIYNNDNYDVTDVKTVVVNVNLNQKLNGLIQRSITEYTAEDLSGLYQVGSGAFAYNNVITSVELPDTVSTIEDYAFYQCASLTDVVIPESVTYIGGSCFAHCHSLQQITLPDNVYHISPEMFLNCSSLTQVNIPSTAEYIAGMAFWGCSSLTEITLPSGLLNIDAGAFEACDSLTEITILATTPPTLEYANAISSATTTIYIPAGTLSAYQSATNWSSFASKFVELAE